MFRWASAVLTFGAAITTLPAVAQDYRSLPSISGPQDTKAVTLAGTLGAADLPRIVDAYKANQLRFIRDFKGKAFAGVLPFRSATQNIVSPDSYTIGLGKGSLTSDLDCSFSDAFDLALMGNWNPGDEIAVTGTVKDVSFGSVQLSPCKMSRK